MKKNVKIIAVIALIAIPSFAALAIAHKHHGHHGPWREGRLHKGDPYERGERPNQDGPHERDEGPGRGKPHEIEVINNYSGKVIGFVANADQMYDSVKININGTENTIKFPPHLAKKVMNLAKPGDSITIGGITNEKRRDGSEIRLVSLTNGNNTIYDSRPVRENESEQMVSIESKIEDIQLNKDGKISGVYLKDNTLLKLPPPAIDQLGKLLVKGETIKATGMLKNAEEGFVFAKNTRLIDDKIITIQGKSYLIR
jgi:hypothetical protein